MRRKLFNINFFIWPILITIFTYTFLIKDRQEAVSCNINFCSKIDDPDFASVKILFHIEENLRHYLSQNEQYPQSGDDHSKFQSILNANWLDQQELAKLTKKMKIQLNYYDILYKSDGANFKLIRHKPSDCNSVRNLYPQLIDPKRKCRAYGIWTKEAKRW